MNALRPDDQPLHGPDRISVGVRSGGSVTCQLQGGPRYVMDPGDARQLARLLEHRAEQAEERA